MKIGETAIKKPGIVLIFTGIIIIISMISAINVEMISGIDSFFAKENKAYQNYKIYEKNFQRVTGAIFILLKGDDVISYESFEYMLKLGEEIEKIEGVEKVTSPASILEESIGYIPSDEMLLKDLSDRFFTDLIPKPTLAMLMIEVLPAEAKKQEEIAKNIETKIRSIEAPSGFTIEITGSPVLGYQIKSEIMESLRTTMMTSILLMILFLVVTFSGVVRKKVTTLLPLLISVSAVIITYGLMPVFGIPLSEHTNGALPMLIGLSIEYAVQIQNRFEEEIRKHGVDEALKLSISRTGRALSLAFLTTAIGFLSMLSAGVPAMSWFGIISTIGLLIALILSLTFLPAILKLIEGRRVERKEIEKIPKLEKGLSIISNLTANRPFGILVFAIFICGFGFYVSPMIELETNYNKYIPQELPAIQKFRELEEIAGGQTIYTLVLETNGVDTKIIKEADGLAEFISKSVTSVYSHQSPKSLVDSYGSLEKIPEGYLSKFISGSTIAVHLYSTANGYEEFKRTMESIEKSAKFYGWDGEIFITGQPVLYSEIGTIMIESQTKMTFVAYLTILILLLGIYKSIRKSIVPLIAITTVIGIMNTVMFLSGVKQTMVSIALNSIVLGLGIDFSIMITERYFEERQKVSEIEAVRRAIEKTGKATTTSALAMIGGFGSLMTSTFPIMRDFGFLALVAISFSLLAAFTVVPAFLMITEKVTRKLGLRITSIK
ncbi:MAG: hydrophobe/amphiphile efflux-3 (HAE3) family transporter [Archaeoglobaceae archaeon]|nr:hydrophobe/amphiphile efflux-3 (HAE3) family transporter [Archaeoglobaceae archaeon]MDW7989095.1 hydrophobe/amphiphile efflux-3 (HAE3) family transporter [Archaeoglobaceae archaeon]